MTLQSPTAPQGRRRLQSNDGSDRPAAPATLLAMDDIANTANPAGDPVPQQLRFLFNRPDDVRVRHLPCALPDDLCA
ncbi:hypothetical protein GCM10022255_091930 [Dactylosporangium darangshiense]|uniref:Uncharacterized protein n=1 Tax=Dactylosporangium darangshiense TaxID=579108 RepID=A0ABP8DPV9_9ACTN